MKKIPNVFVIVFALILLAALLTWILPGGHYQRKTKIVNQTKRVVLVPGTYQKVESKAQTYAVFTAPIKGFLKLAEIIAFIFIVGGAFFMLNETGAIAAGIGRLVTLLKGREYLVIPLVMTLFSFFGAAFGMCEEAMPFAMIFVPLALALGYDSLVGVSLTFVAAGIGFAGAFFNPFTLQIAQGLAGVEPLSGMGYRLIVWVIVTITTIAWIMRYAAIIKKDPTKSPMFDLDQARREDLQAQQAQIAELNGRHILVLVILATAIIFMIYGVIVWKWYIKELAGLFLAMGITAALAGGSRLNDIAQSFVEGCKDIASAALIVGFAGGIIVILEDGKIMDTMLYGMASATSSMPTYLAVVMQYMLQMALNFFIPSGSTKAALTMPLMGPLSDLSGLSRQTSVLAYQFGDGFTNLIIPTSGITVGTLGIAKIPLDRWMKWHIRHQIFFFFMSLLLLIWPVLTNWQ